MASLNPQAGKVSLPRLAGCGLLGPLVRLAGHLEALERELRRVRGLCALLEEMRGAHAARGRETNTSKQAKTEALHGY